MLEQEKKPKIKHLKANRQPDNLIAMGRNGGFGELSWN